jgi:restriction system protein
VARKSGSVPDLLLLLPWWVSVIAAAAAYFLLGNAPGLIQTSNPYLADVVSGLPRLAPWVGLLLLLPAPFSAMRQWRGKRSLDQQDDLDTVRALDWRQIELLIAEGFRDEGYTIVDTPRGADGGADIVLFKGTRRILVQCKHWKTRRVGVRVVREMLGVVSESGAQAGIIASAGAFTRDAEEFAEKNRIRLIDGQELVSMLNIKGNVKKLATSPPRDSTPAPSCPHCNAPMVLRTAREGQFAGQMFWACSNSADCRN